MPGYGGYSYYTTCMIDTDKGNVITYCGPVPRRAAERQQRGLADDPRRSRWTSATPTTYYNVSTVNYLAAGSCNFNDNGKTLWPLDQIVADTQYYVRDAVIDYVKAQTGTDHPEDRRPAQLHQRHPGPVITIDSPTAKTY